MRGGLWTIVSAPWIAAALACTDLAHPQPDACGTPWRPFDPAVDVDYEAYAVGSARARCPKPWTVLVYMAADVEDLPPYALADLREMEDTRGGVSAASSERADVVVQLDLPAPPGLHRYHLFSRADGVAPASGPSSPEVQVLPETDDPPARALAEFIAWGRTNYPSEHLMVVLWGHGQGWRPRSAEGDPVRYTEGGFVGGFGFDHAQETVIDVPSLAEALQTGAGGVSIDVLVTDACLMQSVDVVGALAGVARHIVGHEQTDPYGGFQYEHVIPLINGRSAPAAHPACPSDDEACRVAAALPGQLGDPGSADETFVASAVAGSVLSDALVPALARLSSALIAFLDEDGLRAIDVQARLHARLPGEGVPGFAGNTVDLGVLLTRLRQEAQEEGARCDPPCPAVTQLLAAIADTERALDDAVLAVGVGPAYAADEAYAWTPGPAGLAVWMPPRADVLAARRAAFASSPARGWLPWLDRLYAPGF